MLLCVCVCVCKYVCVRVTYTTLQGFVMLHALVRADYKSVCVFVCYVLTLDWFALGGPNFRARSDSDSL